MTSVKRTFLLLILSVISSSLWADDRSGTIFGKIMSTDGEPVEYATLLLKGTQLSCSTDEKGLYQLDAPSGDYTLIVSSIGFERIETPVSIKAGNRTKFNIKLKPSTLLAEVIVVGSPLSKVKNSSFNATAVNTRELVNTTKTLS